MGFFMPARYQGPHHTSHVVNSCMEALWITAFPLAFSPGPSRQGRAWKSSVMGTGIKQARLCAKAGVGYLSEMEASWRCRVAWAGGRRGKGRASWPLLRKESTGKLRDVVKSTFLSTQTFFFSADFCFVYLK